MHKVLRAVLLAYAAIVLAAIGRSLLRDPVIETPRIGSVFSSSADPARRNLAQVTAGGVVRVSSYDVFRYHHPLFAVDGEASPTLVEKWASARNDPSPWIEVRLPAPAQIEGIRLVLGGAYESDEFTQRDYSIVCLRSDEPGAPVTQLDVRGNSEARPYHEVMCADTLRLRVNFGPEPWPRAVVRLYELEVWGR
jgi:hypothetical protein